MEQRMQQTMQQSPLPVNEKMFMLYPKDDGSREACSVFYSFIIIAKSPEEAIDKFCKRYQKTVEYVKSEYEVEERKFIY